MALTFVPNAAPTKLTFVPNVNPDDESSNPFVREGQSQLSDIRDAADSTITSLLNLPHHLFESAQDLATGGIERTPGPASVSPETAADMQPGVIPKAIGAGLKKADTAIGNVSPTGQDVLHHTGRVLGDVADLSQVVPIVKGVTAIPGAIGDAVTRAAAAGPVTDMDSALKAVGFRRLPRQGEDSAAANLGTKITGEQPIAQQQTLTNQSVADTLAKHEAGVPQGTELNYDNLKAARKAGPAKVYDAARNAMPTQLLQDPELANAIKGIGDTTSQLPKSPDVDALKQTMLNQPSMSRDELFANIEAAHERAARAYASQAPEAEAMGDAYNNLAKAYEDFVGRQLGEGSPVTLEQWQAARTQFAKNYAVQGALSGTSIDGGKLGALQKKDPDQLTGGLRLIAEQNNRYPLSSGFGPKTFEPSGIGASGSPQGIVARHVTGPVIGAGVGSLFGAPLVGSAAGLLSSEALQSTVRRLLGGNPLRSGKIAEGAIHDPRLGSFFDQEVAPYKEQPGLPPFPGPDEPLSLADELGAGSPPSSPGKGASVRPNPNPLDEGKRPEELTTGEHGAGAGGLPYNVHPDSVGLSPLRSGRKVAEGAAPHSIIGLDGEPVETGVGPKSPVGERLSLDEEIAPTGAKSDVPEVGYQNRSKGRSGQALKTTGGVPEDIMTRAENNASGESSASLEAINRNRIEQASGQDRFLIDPDGKMWPIKGVDAVDFKPQKGSVIVQKGVGAQPYTILDRGGLPQSHAKGLLNRALGGGTGLSLMDDLGG